MTVQPMIRSRLPLLLLPAVALLAVLPLIVHGCSCGHDFDFHLLSWFEAATQIAHGNLHPHWAFTPAWNAGEPRFVFYPPLSWYLGAFLGLVMPWTWTPIVYTWLALTAAGVSCYYLLRDFAPPATALLVAALYTVNPYMLFTAYERTAFAELLCAAWLPLLLHAILRERVTIPRIAIPVALLWLTNAPAAVLACYGLAILGIARLLVAGIRTCLRTSASSRAVSKTNNGKGEIRGSLRCAARWCRAAPVEMTNVLQVFKQLLTDRLFYPDHRPVKLALNTTAGTALGIGLAAFYILPAAYERRYVEIALAKAQSLLITDNFLFKHTGDAAHDAVLHTASVIATALLLATAFALVAAFLRNKQGRPTLLPLAILTVAIAFLLTSLSTPVWLHAPDLAFLQFPWRFVALLTPALALVIALALNGCIIIRIQSTAAALVLTLAFALTGYHRFHQECDPEDTPPARLALFHSATGSEPTDEYTPDTGDEDSLSQTNPPFWLASDPTAPAPNNAAPGPLHWPLDLTSATPQTLVLNLRDYPAWRITLNHQLLTTRLERQDGLIALPVPAGRSHLDIAYATSLDQTLGWIISGLSITTLLVLLRRQSS